MTAAIVILTMLAACNVPQSPSTSGDKAIDDALELMAKVDHMSAEDRYEWCMEYMPRLWVDAPFTLESGCERVVQDWPEPKAEIVALTLIFNTYEP